MPLATVDFVRAAVLYEQQRLEEAAVAAQAAELGFAHGGEENRRMKALYLRANLRYEARDIRAAVPLYQEVLRYGENLNDLEWIARASYAARRHRHDAARAACPDLGQELGTAAALGNSTIGKSACDGPAASAPSYGR